LECLYSSSSCCFLLLVFAEKDNRIEHTNYNILSYEFYCHLLTIKVVADSFLFVIINFLKFKYHRCSILPSGFFFFFFFFNKVFSWAKKYGDFFFFECKFDTLKKEKKRKKKKKNHIFNINKLKKENPDDTTTPQIHLYRSHWSLSFFNWQQVALPTYGKFKFPKFRVLLPKVFPIEVSQFIL
jgi:hypothetical protein